MTSLEDYLSAHDAAAAMGIEYKTLLQRISRNTVGAVKVGRTVLVPKEEVIRVKGEQGAGSSN